MTKQEAQELHRKFNSLDNNAVQPISRKWEESRLVIITKLFINKCDGYRAAMLWSADLYNLIGDADIDKGSAYLYVRDNAARIMLLDNSRKVDFTLFVLKLKKLLEEANEEDHAAIFKDEFDAWV